MVELNENRSIIHQSWNFMEGEGKVNREYEVYKGHLVRERNAW